MSGSLQRSEPNKKVVALENIFSSGRKSSKRRIHSRIKKDSFNNVEVFLRLGTPRRGTLREKLDVEAQFLLGRVKDEEFRQIE